MQVDRLYSPAVETSTSRVDPKVAVIQDGARMHYAVPIAFQRANMLERVFTDWYTRLNSLEGFVTAALRLVNPGRARRMHERFAAELDATKVYSKPSLVFSQFMGRRHFKSDIEYFAWMSDLVAQWVLDRGFGASNVLFGFVRNIFPGLCSTARHQGLKIVTDQIIAPYSIEHDEAMKQRERFPAWGPVESSRSDRMLVDFERGTWESSDLITCASDYVREGLINCGVEASRVVVVPYPFDLARFSPTDRRGRTGPITVGFVGQVGLRKGCPYFFEVARKVDPAVAKFVMVGTVALDREIAEQYRGQVELVGPTPRSNIAGWMEKFDVLLFPSTCEGSAGAVTEAMMSGLPIVTSPNSGTLVRHGIDGFVCPYDDTDRMADDITRLANDPEQRHQMGTSARARAEAFDIDYYGKTLRELCERLLNG